MKYLSVEKRHWWDWFLLRMMFSGGTEVEHLLKMGWLLSRNGWPKKGVKPYFQPGPLSEILTIANLWHATSRIWTCVRALLKVCSSDNRYTMAPRSFILYFIWINIFNYYMILYMNYFTMNYYTIFYNTFHTLHFIYLFCTTKRKTIAHNKIKNQITNQKDINMTFNQGKKIIKWSLI